MLPKKRLTVDPNRLRSRIKSKQIAHVVHKVKKDTLPRKAKHKGKLDNKQERL